MGVLRNYLQRVSRLGPRQAGRPQAAGSPRFRLLPTALAPLALSLGLTACEATQSYERSSEGSTVYLDELGDAAKAEARQKIAQILSHGVAVYALGVGDEIDVFFHISRKATSRPYVITATDKVRIEFLGDTENSQTVQVRPDGRISLPLIGPVMAAGQTASGLAQQLQARYSGVLTEPKITVNVTQAHTPLDDFFEALGASGKGRSLADKVLPDGTMSLPLLPPIAARGRTLADLKRDIDAAYQAKGLDVFVSLAPRTLRSNAALVIGEVSKPGRLDLTRPITVAMAVAQAGGALPTGAQSSVRIFYIGSDGAPRVRSINLNDVLDGFRLEDDMIVPPNSIIYVPPTELAKTGRLLNAVLHDVLRFQGFSIGGGYAIE
jgi:protein involved in polysaccharide export with SLBB domain